MDGADFRWTPNNQPFWLSDVMFKEGLFFIEERKGQITAPLLFPPARVLSLDSATGERVFEPGRDYIVDKTAGLVSRPEGSRIPFTPQDERSSVMFAEADTFHRRQATITYHHEPDLWRGYAPTFSAPSLPNTWQRLVGSKPLRIGVLGDSISEGYDASGFTGSPPFQPSYPQIVAAGLERAFGSSVSLHNCAVAGSTAEDGVWQAAGVATDQPHLVIVGYGMNDGGYVDAPHFSANIGRIMAAVRDDSPETEFVLVSPMLPNPEWDYPVMERFPAYRDALAKLCEQGVVQADLTSLWESLLRRKRWFDLAGNGINHPNDFGHRLYAQVILALFH